MKKSLAILISVAMVLSLMAGLFTFSLTSNAATTTTAADKADAVWAAAEKTTAVSIDGVTFDSEDETELTTISNKFTGGTVSLVDGVLTVNNPTFKNNVDVTTLGGTETSVGLKVVINGGDWYGRFYNQSDSGKNVGGPLLVTANGYDIISNASNTLRAGGDLIMYGDIGLKVNTVGYDAIIVDSSLSEDSHGELVLGGSRPVEITSGSADSNGGQNTETGALIENRRGSIIFCDDVEVTVNDNAASIYTRNVNSVATPTRNYAKGVQITSGATGTDACISVLDNASLTVNVPNTGLALWNTAKNVTGDAVYINTTGTVKLEGAHKHGQDGLIYVTSGSVHFSAGDILLHQESDYSEVNSSTYGNGTRIVAALNNTHLTDLIVLDGTANVVAYTKDNVINDNTNLHAFYYQYGIMTVKDDAQLTLYVDESERTVRSDRLYAIWAPGGGFHVQDEAKVFINIEDNISLSHTYNNYIRFDWLSTLNKADITNFDELVGQCGIQVSGGQLTVSFACDRSVVFYPVFTNDVNANKTYADGLSGNLASTCKYTGGVVVFLPKSHTRGGANVFSANPGSYSGAVMTDSTGRANDAWRYFGTGASYEYFDNIDMLGIDGLVKGDQPWRMFNGESHFTAPYNGTYSVTVDGVTSSVIIPQGLSVRADSVVMTKKDPNPYTSVTLYDTDGTTVRKTFTATGTYNDPDGTGTAAFNITTGTLTLTNYDGGKIEASQNGGKTLTVLLVGTNNLTNSGDRAIYVNTDGSNTSTLIIRSNEGGTLNATAARYVLTSQRGHVIIDGNATVNGTATGNAAVFLASGGATESFVVVRGSATATGVGGTQPFSAQKAGTEGAAPVNGIIFENNAKVTSKPASGNAVNAVAYGYILVRDNAQVTIDGSNATNGYSYGLAANSTGGIITVTDNAQVEITDAGNAVSAHAGITVSGNAEVTLNNSFNRGLSVTTAGDVNVTDHANVTVDNANSGSIYTTSGDVNITTDGTVTITRNRTLWDTTAAIYSTSGNVTIANATVNITSRDGVYTTQGIYVPDGNLTVTDATVKIAMESANTKVGVNVSSADSVTITNSTVEVTGGDAAERNQVTVNTAKDKILTGAEEGATVAGFEIAGSQIRVNDKPALRFVARLSEAKIAELKTAAGAAADAEVTYGVLLQYREAADAAGVDLVLENATKSNLNGDRLDTTNLYNTVNQVDDYNNCRNEGDGYFYYTAAITGLTAPYYDKAFVARAYVTINGVTFYTTEVTPDAGYKVNGAEAVYGGYSASLIDTAYSIYNLYQEKETLTADEETMMNAISEKYGASFELATGYAG